MKKIIIILIILALIGAILWFLFGQSQPAMINNQLSITNQLLTNQPVNQEVNQPQELTAERKAAIEKVELSASARNFIERYGSFSTDAQFANLYDLKNKMTERFWQETENYIKQNESKEVTEFYGITAKVLNIEEEYFSDNSVQYLISLQRDETKNQERKVFYQDAEMKLIKEEEIWKIDSVIWK